MKNPKTFQCFSARVGILSNLISSSRVGKSSEKAVTAISNSIYVVPGVGINSLVLASILWQVTLVRFDRTISFSYKLLPIIVLRHIY